MTWLVAAQIAGGVVLFLLGMQSLSQALRTAAGERLRTLLNTATASRTRALMLGASAGFVAHSTAATVMTVGFVNAGFLTLAAALPVLFGANVGTTLSMQVISFRLTDYALAAVALGGVIYLLIPAGRWRLTGQAVLGFGLLFFGMKVSGEAIVPFRDALEPWLARIDGSTWTGLLAGTGAAALVTMIVQSSGAVIGMVFVLAGAGAFSSLWQTFPIVLGAHIGTTLTALLASIGTSAEARRAAIANIAFNLFNATLAVTFARILVPALEATAPDVVRQTANAHTAMMVLAALLLLPFTPALARALRRVAWPSAPEPTPSFLDSRLLATPEDALLATMRELARCTKLAAESFRLVLDAIRQPESLRTLKTVERNEVVIDEIKASARSYLATLARRKPTNRQAWVIQALNRCVAELERIGDHVDRLRELIVEAPALEGDLREAIAGIAARALEVVERVEASFASDDLKFDEPSWSILEARNRYRDKCAPVKARLTGQLLQGDMRPAVSLALSELVTTCDRIVRHCAVIAQEQRQSEFALDPARLRQSARDASPTS